MEVLIVCYHSFAGKVRVHDPDSATEISNLVGNGAYQYACRGHELPQTKLLTVPKILGGVEHNSSQQGTGSGLIRREPDAGDEHFPVITTSSTLP